MNEQNKRSWGNRVTTGRLALGLAMVLAAGALVGCSGQGKYTKEHMSGAKMKMEALKSATEFKMAEQAFMAGDLPKAQRHVDYSITLNKRVARSHVLRGRVMMEMGHLEDCAASLAEARRLEEKNVDAIYFQGLLAERIDRKEEALAKYQEAFEIAPTSAQYAIAAAEMMVELGRVDEARAFLEGKREAFQHNAGVRQTLGHIALIQNRGEDAVALFSDARLLAPDDAMIIEDLVRAQLATGRVGEAEYNLSRLLSGRAKDRRDLMQMRAACLVELERHIEARDLLVKLTTDERGASDIESWIGLGQVAYTLRDQARVKQASARIVALDPKRPEGHMLRALYLRRNNDLPGARRSVETALNLKRTGEGFVLLGMILTDLGDEKLARRSFEMALSVEPGNDAATHFLRGQTTANVPTE